MQAGIGSTGMSKTLFGDIAVYNLSSGKSVPQWLADSRRSRGGVGSLRYNDAFRRRIELIQDFEFNTASQQVRVSGDGQFIGAIGCYPPEIRIFETGQLGMKFMRRLDHEAIAFDFLGDDYKKLAILQTNRVVEFHSQFGKHHSIRIPHEGRDMAYDRSTCVLYVASSSDEIYRVDLEEGIFATPIKCPTVDWDGRRGGGGREGSNGISCLALSPTNLPLLVAGGESGMAEAWDTRAVDRKPASLLEISSLEVTKMAWSPDGMQLAAGDAEGTVRVFDIRSAKPLYERSHRNDLRITGLEFHSRGVLGSADARGVKIWKEESTKVFTSVQSAGRDAVINGLTFWPSDGRSGDAATTASGMFFTACDQPRIGTYFVPQLGIAPKWCAFLDAMTEELEDSAAGGTQGQPGATVTSHYEDYVFLTREQLCQLPGGDSLIGTPVVRAYMHGFWIDRRLCDKLTKASQPFVLAEYEQKKMQEKLESKRPMRIPVKKFGVSALAGKRGVNQRLRQEMEEKAQKTGKTNERAAAVLTDSRLGALFENPDFEVDEVRAGEVEHVLKEDQDRRYREAADKFMATQAKEARNKDSDDDDDGDDDEAPPTDNRKRGLSGRSAALGKKGKGQGKGSKGKGKGSKGKGRKG